MYIFFLTYIIRSGGMIQRWFCNDQRNYMMPGSFYVPPHILKDCVGPLLHLHEPFVTGHMLNKIFKKK